ncbi:MAG: hypothetical protein V3U52_04095 [Thermoplasmata archaeon]
MVTFSFDRKVALLILLAGAISAGLTAIWVPMSALHQDFDTVILPASGELRIPLLVLAPLVLGAEVDLVASTLDEGEDVVFQLLYNDNLMAESERYLETSFTIEKVRDSASGLVLVATNRAPTPVTVHYSAGALRSAFGVERFSLGALLFLPLAALLALHQTVLRPQEGMTKIARRSFASLFLTGWVFFLYVELLVGILFLGFNFDLGALRGFFGYLLLLSVRTPFVLLPTFSAVVGLILVLEGKTGAPAKSSRLSIAMGVAGLAIIIALFILSQGLGR